AEGDLFPAENAGTPHSVQVAFGGTGLRPSRNPDAADTASPGHPTTLDVREGERGVAPAAKRGRVGLPLVETVLAALGLLILISAHTAWGWVRQARAKRASAAHS